MSSSILTNLSAISAVQNLAATQKSLNQVQNEISTGLAVSSAQDNAAYFSIAQTLRTSVSNLSAVSSSLNLGSSVVATATAATNNVYSVLQSIQKDLVSASQSGNDLASLQSGIDTLRQQLGTTVATASFNGVNLLDGSNTSSVSFVSGVTGSGANTVVNQLQVATSQTNLSGATYVVGSNAIAKAATTAAAASTAYTNALSAFSTALGNVAGGITAATLNNTSAAADATASEKNLAYIFGSTATVSGSTISHIDGNSIAGKLLGSGGSYTFAEAPTSFAADGALTAGSATATTDVTSASDTSAAAAYNKALNTFNTAVGALKTSDYTAAGGAGSTALQAIFGAGATVDTSDATKYVITISATETAASDSGVALLGQGGTYTIPVSAVSGTAGATATTVSKGTLGAGTGGAQNAFTTAQTAFVGGVGGVDASNYKSFFGATATYSAATGTVSNIDSNSTGGQFLGGTGASYQLAVGTAGSVANTTTGGVTTNTSGALGDYYGTSSTTSTIDSSATTGTLGAAYASALTAVQGGNTDAQTAYLIDTAATATNSFNAATSAYTTAQTNFTTAVASLTQTDFASGSDAFKAVFGTSASFSSSTGKVTGVGADSTAAALFGTAGTYTVATGAYKTDGTDANSGGALFTLYGSDGTSATTDATADAGAAKVAATAVKAVNSNTAASAIYNGALFSISQINLVGASQSQIANYTSQVGAALKSLTNAQVVLGAAASNLDLQSTYTSSLSDSLTTGVGSLVDADLNEASTRLNALQTQQQLGVQALSVANQNSQLILKLFQG